MEGVIASGGVIAVVPLFLEEAFGASSVGRGTRAALQAGMLLGLLAVGAMARRPVAGVAWGLGNLGGGAGTHGIRRGPTMVLAGLLVAGGGWDGRLWCSNGSRPGHRPPSGGCQWSGQRRPAVGDVSDVCHGRVAGRGLDGGD